MHVKLINIVMFLVATRQKVDISDTITEKTTSVWDFVPCTFALKRRAGDDDQRWRGWSLWVVARPKLTCHTVVVEFGGGRQPLTLFTNI